MSGVVSRERGSDALRGCMLSRAPHMLQNPCTRLAPAHVANGMSLGQVVFGGERGDKSEERRTRACPRITMPVYRQAFKTKGQLRSFAKASE